jgi:hypothetical protein
MNFNDIANEKLKEIITNANERAYSVSETEVEIIADKLVAQLGNGSFKWRPFYCRVARSLPEAKVWELVERAKRNAIKSVGGYFMTIAYKEMVPIYKLGDEDEIT